MPDADDEAGSLRKTGRLDQVLRLRDGRALGFASFGDIAGAPLIYLHGSLSSRLEARLLHAAAMRLGVHVLAIDRPGHGLSSPHAARTLLSLVEDLRELASHLGLDRFGIAGWSAGGAYAAVAARVLGDRVTRLSLIAAQAPSHVTRSVVGRPLVIRLFEALARRTTAHLRLTAWVSRRLVVGLGRRLFEHLPGAIFSRSDRAALHDRAFNGVLAEAWTEGLRAGSGSAARDVGLVLGSWTLVAQEGSCPVDIWCGEDDRLCPPSYGRWFAGEWRQSTLHVLKGHGHLHIAALASEILAGHASPPASARLPPSAGSPAHAAVA